MLRGEDWYMVRDLLRSGVSLSEISRRTGFNRKTIRKLRDQPAHPPPLRRSRSRLLDPYRSYLTARAERGVLNATKLYAEVQRQGYPGGVAQVRRFLAPLRPRTATVVTRFETLPGQQAQVDWSHCGVLGPESDRRTLSAFVLTLGYSRRQYIEFTRSQDLETFLRCHVHAFAYFGGVPAELLYDNLKTAVDHRTPAGGIVWNSRFRDLADSYGFTPHACQPYRPQTKGKVERSIGYLKGNFLLGRELETDTLATLNRDVLLWLRETADLRVHGTIQERPCDLGCADDDIVELEVGGLGNEGGDESGRGRHHPQRIDIQPGSPKVRESHDALHRRAVRLTNDRRPLPQPRERTLPPRRGSTGLCQL